MMIIIDVGAHNGSVASLPFAQDKNNLVYAIEPIPKFCDQLCSYGLSNLHVFNMAMGDCDTKMQFHINQNHETSSLLMATCVDEWAPYATQLESVETIEVLVMRLDSFMQNNSIIEVDLLKIDAQGYDLKVLEGAGELISCIKKIIVEVQLFPLYKGSSTKESVIEYLSRRGFYLTFATPQTGGLEENLEFERVNRYSLNLITELDQTSIQKSFKVKVPHVGVLTTPKDDHVGQLLERGIFEGAEQAFLWLYLRPGDVFLDCGAHVGLFSCIAAQCVGSRGKIVGFEPNPYCSDLYRTNLEKLNCHDFTILNVGLSDQNGSGELYLGKPGMSAFSTLAVEAVTHTQLGEEKIEVELCCLDDVITDLKIPNVALAKMDVEGWEGFVLKGASQSIKMQKLPVWMIEFTESNAVAAGSSTQELRSLIESFGYTLCRFDATRLRLVPEPFRSEYPYENLFAVVSVEEVNLRLSTASASMLDIAKDVIARWDFSMIGLEFSGQFAQERRVVQDLRSQISRLTAELESLALAPTASCSSDLLNHIELLEEQIQAMESSKFWQLRKAWFRVKKMLNLPVNE